MKKVLLTITIILTVFLMTACGTKSNGGSSGGGILNTNKTMTCTKEETEDGKKISETMVITYNSKKVLKVNDTQLIETETEYRDFALSVGISVAEEMSKVDGMTVEYSGVDLDKIKIVMDVDFDKINLEQLKEALGELYDEEDTSFYGKKEITIDEFKKENLEGYTCK